MKDVQSRRGFVARLRRRRFAFTIGMLIALFHIPALGLCDHLDDTWAWLDVQSAIGGQLRALDISPVAQSDRATFVLVVDPTELTLRLSSDGVEAAARRCGEAFRGWLAVEIPKSLSPAEEVTLSDTDLKLVLEYLNRLGSNSVDPGTTPPFAARGIQYYIRAKPRLEYASYGRLGGPTIVVQLERINVSTRVVRRSIARGAFKASVGHEITTRIEHRRSGLEYWAEMAVTNLGPDFYCMREEFSSILWKQSSGAIPKEGDASRFGGREPMLDRTHCVPPRSILTFRSRALRPNPSSLPAVLCAAPHADEEMLDRVARKEQVVLRTDPPGVSCVKLN